MKPSGIDRFTKSTLGSEIKDTFQQDYALFDCAGSNTVILKLVAEVVHIQSGDSFGQLVAEIFE